VEVKNAIIENGTATGIRLADGSEIAARKLVVSTLSPRQLIFDLIGEQHCDARAEAARQAVGRHVRVPDVVQLRR